MRNAEVGVFGFRPFYFAKKISHLRLCTKIPSKTSNFVQNCILHKNAVTCTKTTISSQKRCILGVFLCKANVTLYE